MKITFENSQQPKLNTKVANTENFSKHNHAVRHSYVPISDFMTLEQSKSLIAQKNISFKGVNNAASKAINGITQAAQITLSEKIGSLLEVMQFGEMVIVGAQFKKAQKGLLNALPNIPQIIKKIFFIEDSAIKAPFGFIKSDSNLIQVINLSSKPTILSTNKMKTILKQDEPYYIVMNEDKLITNGIEIPLTEGKIPVTRIQNTTSTKVFDMSESTKKISNINQKAVESLTLDADDIPTKFFTFADVGGQDDVIQELKKSIIYPLKYPKAFKGTTLNKGIILYGPPGTGKTLLAEALANECDASFIKLNGLEMENKYIGETEKNWRDKFEQARNAQPCIMFIDEFDAVARKRSGSETARYADKTVNQLLTLLSDLEKSNDQVFVIAATNKLNILDDAVIRSGRFGKHILVPTPKTEGCKQILNIHTKKLNIDKNFNPDEFAQKLYEANASGADIAFIAEEAGNKAKLKANIFEKMENGTFQDSDMERLIVKAADFEEALADFINNSSKQTSRKEIGFHTIL